MESWKPLKLSFNLATGKTNLDAFVLAQARHTHFILLGRCSILGSHAAQENFLWPLHKANTSAGDNAVSPQGLQELCSPHQQYQNSTVHTGKDMKAMQNYVT